MTGHPALMHTVLDAVDVRGLAEFYRRLLGLHYRPDGSPPEDGSADETDWIVLLDGSGRRVLAFQRVEELHPSTWPDPAVPQQLHLDLAVPTLEELDRHRAHAEELGATLLLDRRADDEEPLFVLADPAGHPFCLMVSAG
jgi:catechol 2,3-dioxygenase-like lactoylglutathione lyase family enzyme